jgi:hypothetical protein
LLVIPAKAGIHLSLHSLVIPAKAGIQGLFTLYRTSLSHDAIAVARHPREGWDHLAVAGAQSNSHSFRPSKAGRVTFLC